MLTRIHVDQKWVELWLGEFESPATRTNYARDIARFRSFCDKPFPELTRPDLILFREHLEAQGLGPRSRNRTMAAIKSLLGFILESEPSYLPRNVAASIKAETYEPARRPGPSPQQTEALLAVKLDPVDRLALAMLYFLGSRASELAAIHWADFTAGANGVKVLIHGKGGHTYQSEIPTGVFEALKALRGEFDPPLPLNRFQLYRRVKRAGKAVGVPEVSPHRLRHACATHLASAGIPQHLVSQHLGHRNVQTTQQYFDAIPDERVITTLTKAVSYEQ